MTDLITDGVVAITLDGAGVPVNAAVVSGFTVNASPPVEGFPFLLST